MRETRPETESLDEVRDRELLDKKRLNIASRNNALSPELVMG